MTHRVISNKEDIAGLALLLGGVKLPVTVQWIQGKDRTAQQNALQWMWAGEAAEQRGDVMAADVQRQWKLHHGVPILRTDNPDFREIYDSAIKPLPYEMKIAAMDMIAVTSIMKLPQMIAYMDEVQRKSVEAGIILTEPDPDLVKYQDRYREKAPK